MSDRVETAAKQAGWRARVESYASADPRSLGLFRIALGTLLFLDAARR
jgi:hypothetical protein